MRGPTGAKFCTMVSTRPNFIMPVQNFGARTPKKFQGPKTCKIWPDFGRLRSSAANISETDEDIQILMVTSSIAIPPALGETSPVKFGPVTLEIYMLNRTHLKCIFRKTVFQPLRGAALPNFYTRYLGGIARRPSLTSAPPIGDGGPPYNFFQRGVKNCLKM